MVLLKKSGGRRRRSRLVPVEICEVHRGGMYGEITYSVWLLDSGRMIDFVRTDELRFKHHYDLEKRLRDDEILRRRDEEYSRNHWETGFSRGRRMDTYRGERGRSQRTARAWQPRARSADGNFHITERRDVQHERALSVPPENTNWPAFLAEFTRAMCQDKRVDRDNSGDELQPQNIHNKRGLYSKDVRHSHDYRIYEEEEDDRVINQRYIGGDHIDDRPEYKERQVERTPMPARNYIDRRPRNYKMNFKDHAPRDLRLNFVFQDSRSQQDRDF